MRRAALAALALAACLGQTPEDEERDAVVSVGRHGPTHNPGSPCLLCHGFALAGTVYRLATDDSGQAGATITITDSDAHVFSAVSNSTGNFYVDVDTGASAPRSGQEGEEIVPWNIAFPVNVTVTANGVTTKMRNRIHQWGSCAECHKPDLGATSNGRVYTEVAP